MREGILTCLIFLILSGAILAGCLEREPGQDDCPDDACVEQDEGNGKEPPPPGLDGFELPNGTIPTFQLRDCEAFSFLIDVPHDELDQVVPDEFRMESFAPGILGNVQIQITECSDSLDSESIFGPIRMYMVMIPVVPANESWADPGELNRYLLDIATDHDGWNEAFERANLSFDKGSFSISKHELSAEAFVADFVVSTEDWETSVQFTYVEDREDILTVGYHLWSGDGPFHRTSYFMKYDGRGTPGSSAFVLQGDSTLSSTMPSPVTPYYFGNWRFDMNALFAYDGAWGL